MPDINKQTIVNLLIDSPLREPIKINLIDIVNNTKNEDLSKTYSTILKELEIYSKATERRIKLANEIADKLGNGETSMKDNNTTTTTTPGTNSDNSAPATPDMPTTPTPPPTTPSTPTTTSDTPDTTPSSNAPVTPPTDDNTDTGPKLPPPAMGSPIADPKPDSKLPEKDSPESSTNPTPPAPPTPATTTPPTPSTDQSVANLEGDEEALAEIQKELDTLKNSASEDATSTTPPSTVPSTEEKPAT